MASALQCGWGNAQLGTTVGEGIHGRLHGAAVPLKATVLLAWRCRMMAVNTDLACRRLLTAATRLRSQVRSRGFCAGRRGNVAGFPVLQFHCQFSPRLMLVYHPRWSTYQEVSVSPQIHEFYKQKRIAYCGRGMKLTTDLQLVPTSRMREL
jgi:hypothetical protein